MKVKGSGLTPYVVRASWVVGGRSEAIVQAVNLAGACKAGAAWLEAEGRLRGDVRSASVSPLGDLASSEVRASVAAWLESRDRWVS